jgi:hypothetical protein
MSGLLSATVSRARARSLHSKEGTETTRIFIPGRQWRFIIQLHKPSGDLRSWGLATPENLDSLPAPSYRYLHNRDPRIRRRRFSRVWPHSASRMMCVLLTGNKCIVARPWNCSAGTCRGSLHRRACCTGRCATCWTCAAVADFADFAAVESKSMESPTRRKLLLLPRVSPAEACLLPPPLCWGPSIQVASIVARVGTRSLGTPPSKKCTKCPGKRVGS